MKSTIKNIIKVIVYIIIILFLFKYLFCIYVPFSYVYLNKKSDSYSRYKKNTIDIIYLGPSGINNDISPIKIYENYGITGFDVSSGGTSIGLNYFQINSLKINKKQNIKFLFLDLGTYFTNIVDRKDKTETLHQNMDFYSFGKAKIDFVNDSKYNFSNADKVSYLIPFFSYHDMWNKSPNQYFNFKNLRRTKTCENGLCAGMTENCNVRKVAKQNYMQVTPDKEYDSYENSNYEDLLKIKNYCEKNNIKLVLIATPDPATWDKSKNETIKKLASDNNLEYLDFNTMYNETKIDMDTDFWDGSSHLNPNGQIKLSNYIGQYLKDNYNLEDHRGDPKYKQWDKDLEEYEKYEKEWINKYNKNLENLQKQQEKSK